MTDDRARKMLCQRGFTLVELMIVVAVLGILMIVAIPMYRNFQKKAKGAEARSNLGGIRTAMIAYYAENSTFSVGNVGTVVLDGSDNSGTPYGSSRAAIGQKLGWNRTTPFSKIGYAPEGGVYYNYSLLTSDPGVSPVGFTAMASADLDDNALISHFYLTESSPALNRVGDGF
jgi:prepilin-type N-terminal cleavage/methylation domain-containing protein